MSQIAPERWVKRLRFRSEYLGWFIASILFAILCHLLLVVGIIGVSLDLVPMYAMLFLGGVNFASLTGFGYFATRMLAPVESARAFLETKRRIVVIILASCLLLIQLTSVLSNLYFNIPQPALSPLAVSMVLLYYFLAVIAGYDSARTQDAKIRLETSSSHASNGSPLYEVIQGRSKRKTIVVAAGLFLIFAMVSLFTSVIEGLSVAGSIAGVLAFVVQLYLKDD